MTFVTADRCRTQLERLTRLLVSAFPGSTIYQHTELLRVPHDVLHNKVDAVFLDAEMDRANGSEFIKLLHSQKPDVPVFVVSQSESLCRTDAEAGVDRCFVLPDSQQQLLDAVRSALGEESAS